MATRSTSDIPVINLKAAPGTKESWAQPRWKIYAWGICEVAFVTNPLQVSSRIRICALRLFGAKIGADVIFRPRTRVKFPWNLSVGDRSWIGEGVWIHNQARVEIDSDVAVSQETLITTGSHAHRKDMALITNPITIRQGAWLTSRTIVLGGSRIGRSSLVSPGSVIGPNAQIEDNMIVGGNPARPLGSRFSTED